MSENGWKAVTVNLGGAGPRAGEYRESAFEWALDHLEEYEIVFAQEMHDGWPEASTGSFRVVRFEGKQYRPKSAVLVNTRIAAERFQFATAAYHGSYVAAAKVHHDAIGDLVLLSVHASPSRVSDTWAEQWKSCGLDLPKLSRKDRWDSDLVLESVRRVTTAPVPVVAAGDWNESRRWDQAQGGNHEGTEGVDFFKRVAHDGLIDCCCPRGCEGGDEGATHVSKAGALRLDHVFVTPGIASLIDVAQTPIDEADWPADHRPVEFTIG